MLRAVLVVLAFVAATLTVLDQRSFQKRQSELQEIADRPEVAEVSQGLLDETVRRSTDLGQTAGGIARHLMFTEVGRGEEGITGAAREAAQARLELALELASAALRARPTMESAASALGGANYQLLRRARDRRLVAEARRWEAPLELASKLNAKGDGSRLLAVAYLELWAFLSPEKQEIARGLLAQSLGDQRIFGRVIETWLEIAGSREEAFALVPDRVASWTSLERLYASRRDWDSYLLVLDRRNAALRREVEGSLDEAAKLVRRGRVSEASDRYLGVLAQLPPGVENVPLVERVLAEAPAAAPQEKQQEGVRAWLDWTLDLCRGAGCPLRPESIDRLLGRAGELPPSTRALAALFGGRPVTEHLEDADEDLTTPAWSDYLAFRARSLAERGEIGEALRALAQVHPSSTLGEAYWFARRDVARADGDAEGLERAELELDRLGGTRWPGSSWQPPAGRETAATLQFFTRQGGEGLSLALDAPKTGAAVEVRLDGSIVALAVVSGRSELDLETPIAAGLHRLEVTSRGGGSISPSETSLSV